MKIDLFDKNDLIAVIDFNGGQVSSIKIHSKTVSYYDNSEYRIKHMKGERYDKLYLQLLEYEGYGGVCVFTLAEITPWDVFMEVNKEGLLSYKIHY